MNVRPMHNTMLLLKEGRFVRSKYSINQMLGRGELFIRENIDVSSDVDNYIHWLTVSGSKFSWGC